MISELNKSYNILNKGLFGGKLPKPSFRVDPSSKSAFRFRGQQSDDIIIGLGFTTIDKGKIPDALLHVMVHVSNFIKGIDDCTTNQYHKREFTEAALNVGLTVLKSSSRGWGITTSKKADWLGRDDVRFPVDVSRRCEAYKKIKIDGEKLRVFQEELQTQISSVRKKQFLLKYVCKCSPPHNSIRSGRRPVGDNRLNATCNKCGHRYKVETMT